MGGLSADIVFGIPVVSILFAFIVVPLIRLLQKKYPRRQQLIGWSACAVAFVGLLLYQLFAFRSFSLFASLLAIVPTVVFLGLGVYFLVKTRKRENLAKYRVSGPYKTYLVLVLAIAGLIGYKILFPKPDKIFNSTIKKYFVYAYTGSSCGKTRFELYTLEKKKIGEAFIESACTPLRDGGVYWFKDHVAIDYMAAVGDGHPVYIKFDGSELSPREVFNYDRLYRSTPKLWQKTHPLGQ